jgi:CHAT domain-containing protein
MSRGRSRNFGGLGTHGFFNAEGLLRERRQHEQLLRSWDFRSGRSGVPSGWGRRSPLAFTGLVLAGANYPHKASRDGGILTGEVLALLPLERVQLVVLSACDTGLGDIRARAEGVQSLQRAFHLAGCRNVVAGLWSVADHRHTTPALMKRFYSELAKGTDPIKALRAAQLDQYRNGPKRIAALKRSIPKWKGGLGSSEASNAPKPDAKEVVASTKWSWATFVLSGSGR